MHKSIKLEDVVGERKALGKRFGYSPFALIGSPGHESLTQQPVSEVPQGGPTSPYAPDLLMAAERIMRERASTYDSAEGERSMSRTVNAFNAITGQNMTEAQGWLFMQVLKDVRQWQTPTYHADSAEDGIAYAALKAECLANGGAK